MALLRAGDTDAADMWRKVAVAVKTLEADAAVVDQVSRQTDPKVLSQAS